jgi:hypothetical protein
MPKDAIERIPATDPNVSYRTSGKTPFGYSPIDDYAVVEIGFDAACPPGTLH